jgi:hypothetical protein
VVGLAAAAVVVGDGWPLRFEPLILAPLRQLWLERAVRQEPVGSRRQVAVFQVKVD